MVEQRGIENLTSALRMRRPADRQVFALSKVAATEEIKGFYIHAHPYHPVYVMCCYFGQVFGQLKF
jgi:hypothetical protein